MSMTTLQQEALNRAIKLLQASGLSWAVKMEDGTTLGDLPIAAPEPLRVKRPRVNFWPEAYRMRVKEMQPGQEIHFDIDVGKVDELRSSISSYGSKAHGNGSCITEVIKSASGGRVNILRVE